MEDSDAQLQEQPSAIAVRGQVPLRLNGLRVWGLGLKGLHKWFRA